MNDVSISIRDKIQSSQRVLIVSHIRPDGDGIGSLLALGLGLQDIGKEVQMVLCDGLPSTYRHLPGSDQVRTQASGEFDLIITVDCSDLQRTGISLEGYRNPDIVIDHHLTTDGYGSINLVNPDAVSTTSILFQYMSEWGLSLTPSIAANLITGLVTDTLGFRTANTTSDVLRQAADLIDAGADMSTLYSRSLVHRSFQAVRYWGEGLSRIERTNEMVWTFLTLDDQKLSGYAGNDDADLINLLSSVDDVQAALVFVEQSEGKVKVSWRGLKPDVDVSRVAMQFGGGGHRAAAGAVVQGNLADIQERVLEATQKSINR